jgi:hypothetical protein
MPEAEQKAIDSSLTKLRTLAGHSDSEVSVDDFSMFLAATDSRFGIDFAGSSVSLSGTSL